MSLRSTNALPAIAPVFEKAKRIAGLCLKPKKCVLVLVNPATTEMNRITIRSALTSANLAWAEFEVAAGGKYLGVFLGPGAGTASWAQPRQNWMQRICGLTELGAPAAALAVQYRVRVLPVPDVCRFVGRDAEGGAGRREAWPGELFRLPGSALPRNGMIELSREWGWPRTPAVEAAAKV